VEREPGEMCLVDSRDIRFVEDQGRVRSASKVEVCDNVVLGLVPVDQTGP
jgi:hypothetical protein